VKSVASNCSASLALARRHLVVFGLRIPGIVIKQTASS
jgi:hypothetical protein